MVQLKKAVFDYKEIVWTENLCHLLYRCGQLIVPVYSENDNCYVIDIKRFSYFLSPDETNPCLICINRDESCLIWFAYKSIINIPLRSEYYRFMNFTDCQDSVSRNIFYKTFLLFLYVLVFFLEKKRKVLKLDLDKMMSISVNIRRLISYWFV